VAEVYAVIKLGKLLKVLFFFFFFVAGLAILTRIKNKEQQQLGGKS
jgi:hypothetical protein